MSLDPDRPHFGVATFTNVYDTDPLRDRISLRQLVTGLNRFEVKVREVGRLRREEARIAEAVRAWHDGRALSGSRYLPALHAAAAVPGRAPSDAVDAEAAKLRKNARDAAKKTLPLWSPAVYREGARRGTTGVVGMSVLVLDYDHDASLESAVARWDGWFHVVHSTWSHTRARPRFRMVLPLATAIPASQWDRVWEWADAWSFGGVDPACKGVGGTFALPCTAEPKSDLHVSANAGKLLDPVADGIVPGGPVDVAAPPAPSSSHFRGPEPDKRYVTVRVRAEQLDTTAWDVDAAFDDLF
jgi:hypothetical protein